jgi:hypothetical protein
MITKDSAASQTQSSGSRAGTAKGSVPLPNARDIIEGAGAGSGTVTDPGGTDRRPPNIAELELLA